LTDGDCGGQCFPLPALLTDGDYGGQCFSLSALLTNVDGVGQCFPMSVSCFISSKLSCLCQLGQSCRR